jgi:hypothetical protein
MRADAAMGAGVLLGDVAKGVAPDIEHLCLQRAHLDHVSTSDSDINARDLVPFVDGPDDFAPSCTKWSQVRLGAAARRALYRLVNAPRCAGLRSAQIPPSHILAALSSVLPPAWSWWWWVLRMCVSFQPRRSRASRYALASGVSIAAVCPDATSCTRKP